MQDDDVLLIVWREGWASSPSAHTNAGHQRMAANTPSSCVKPEHSTKSHIKDSSLHTQESLCIFGSTFMIGCCVAQRVVHVVSKYMYDEQTDILAFTSLDGTISLTIVSSLLTWHSLSLGLWPWMARPISSSDITPLSTRFLHLRPWLTVSKL